VVVFPIYPKTMTTKKPLAPREWRYPRTYRTIYAKEPGGIFQADVMVLYPLWNRIFDEEERKKYRPKDYALVCVDVFSRYVWAVAIDNDDFPSIAVAIQLIFVHMGKPKILQEDQKIIDAFRNELSPYITGITLIMSKAHETNKNAIVERAIRTLKNDLLKYLYVYEFSIIPGVDTTSLIIQEICTLRNRTNHRMIEEKPIDVFYRREPNRQIIVKKKYPQYKQGDIILIKPLQERGELRIKILDLTMISHIVYRPFSGQLFSKFRTVIHQPNSHQSPYQLLRPNHHLFFSNHHIFVEK
jgi:transposase InsO family protein